MNRRVCARGAQPPRYTPGAHALTPTTTTALRLHSSPHPAPAPPQTPPLEHTALHSLHLELGGKMVPFAGYSLPVQYPAGVLKSHLHTRAPGCASLFDVGHMGQLLWRGSSRAAFLESVCVADVADIAPGDAKLTLLTSASGGILDDSVITNHGEYVYMVVNGACVCVGGG